MVKFFSVWIQVDQGLPLHLFVIGPAKDQLRHPNRAAIPNTGETPIAKRIYQKVGPPP